MAQVMHELLVLSGISVAMRAVHLTSKNRMASTAFEYRASKGKYITFATD